MSYAVQSVHRGVDILVALRAGPRTVTELARDTGLAKGTAFRIVSSLGHRRFVVKEPGSNRYMLGPGLLPLVYEIHSSFGWIGAFAGDVLEQLWKRTGETVTIHVRMGAERICVVEHPSPKPIRYTAPIGSSAPISVGSAGKVLLAAMDPDDFAKLVNELPLDPITENSITDRARLIEEVELARERGWATSAGERVPGSSAVSVPIHIADLGSMGVIALSVLGPADRIPPERIEEYLPLLIDSAAKIEKQLEDKGTGQPVAGAAGAASRTG